MPSKKQPNSLMKLCTRRVADIAENAFVIIEKHHGDYENSNCRREIQILRNHFLENIGHLFEKVVVEINNPWALHRYTTDPMVFIEFMLHENTQTTYLPILSPKGQTSMHHISTFLAEKLGALKRMTNLDMTEVDCTDEIIKAVSDNCIHLETIHVCSNPLHGIGVTDDGLLLLSKCSELRIIRDTQMFHTISKNTIKLLIVGLPRLIAIDYYRIEAILSTGFENMILPLKCVEVSEYDAINFDAIVKVCPHLERLYLHKVDSSIPDEILNSLTVSNLKLDTLKLINLVPTKHVATLLRENGKYLRTLHITTSSTNKTKEYIPVIGLNCPMLEDFEWLDKMVEENLPIDHHYHMSEQEKHQIFLNLNKLRLRIQASNFNSGIPQLCLRNATNIKDISFIVRNASDTQADMHDLFEEILLKNKMSNLIRLKLYGSYFYQCSSSATFELIFNCLNNLEILEVSKVKPEVVEYFKLMKSTILENNINLTLICYDYGW